MTTHTPTPWYTSEGPKDEPPAAGLAAKHPTKPKMKMSIGILFEGYHAGEAQANAAFIVRAVNAHEELFNTMKALSNNAFKVPLDQWQTIAKQVIARAEGK